MTPTKRVTLDPSESQGVAFVYTPQEAKTYHVAINGLSGSFEATEAPVEEYPFTYEDLEISAPVVVGYPVTIGCRVMLCIAPVGRPITHTVTLYINNTPVSTQEVTLVREFLCAQTRVEFQFTPGSTRTYRVEIDGLTGSFTAVTEVFVNTPLELVRDAVDEFADMLAEKGLSGSGSLEDAYFTFDPTVVQPEYSGLCSVDADCPPDYPECRSGRCWQERYGPDKAMPITITPNANLECTIRLSTKGGWTLGASLIAVKASEYERWLGDLTFGHFYGIHRGRLAGGMYGLGIPHIIEWPSGSGNFRTVITTCGDHPDCHSISNRDDSYGDWARCTLRSGEYKFNVNGLLDLEPGSWVVLASFVLSVCYKFMSPGPKGTEHLTVLPQECYNYKIYRIGTIDF